MSENEKTEESQRKLHTYIEEKSKKYCKNVIFEDIFDDIFKDIFKDIFEINQTNILTKIKRNLFEYNYT